MADRRRARHATTLLLALLAGCATANPALDDAAPTPVVAGDAAAAPAAADADPFATPAGAIRLHAPLPPGWARGYSLRSAQMRIAEYAPPGAAGDDWLRFEEFATPDGADPLSVLATTADGLAASCAPFRDWNTFSGIEAGVATAVRLFACGRSRADQRGLVMMAKAMQHDGRTFVVARSRRTAPFDAPGAPAPGDAATADAADAAAAAGPAPPPPVAIPVEPAVIGAWASWLKAVRLCGGTLAPCPANGPG